MSVWASQVELRDESGEVRAYRTQDGREISIPKFPRPDVSLQEWMDFMSLDALEAFRQVYMDKWTWETDNDDYRLLVDRVASEIDSRAARTSNPQAQQGQTTFDLEHIRQMTDPRNG